MTETMTPTQAPPAAPQPPLAPIRRERATFSAWDQIMRLSDFGLGLWSVLTFVFLFLPIVVLVIFSFNDQKLNVQWTHFTFRWYTGTGQAMADGGKSLFHDSGIQQAFLTSIEIAVLSTILAVIIGVLGSFALERFEFRTKNLWDGLNYTKIVIAEVVAGVSTLLFFVQLNNWLTTYVGFNLWGIFSPGFYTVLIAHVAWNVPFVVVIVRARLKGFDRAIEEAGQDLFARPATVFFRITLPVISPGIMAAALLSFTLSFDDFVTTFFVAGPQINTLPLQIWSMVRMGVTPEINAVSTFMVAFSSIIVIVLELKAHISADIA
jgi:spermidine/putrescine transport system permease protein